MVKWCPACDSQLSLLNAEYIPVNDKEGELCQVWVCDHCGFEKETCEDVINEGNGVLIPVNKI